MPVTTLNTIRGKLFDLLKQVKTANGFSVNIPDANIYSRFDKAVLARRADADYPKAFVFLDEGTNVQHPGGRTEKAASFVVIVLLKKVAVNDDPVEQTEKLAQEIENLIDNNATLGGTVQDARVGAFTTDSGYAHPEGTLVLQIEVSYFKRP
jgi:hypothetical protein